MKFDIAKLAPVCTFIYRLWNWSVRYDDQGEWDAISEQHRKKNPIIIALWHNDLFSLSAYASSKKGEKYVIIVSQSKDGELIARILEAHGHSMARGSSSRGGIRALLTFVREIKKNRKFGSISIDGPRGPRHVIKDGIIFAAQRAGVPIYPARSFPSKKIVFHKSWDRFEVPYPFAKVRIRVGEPYLVTSEELTAEVLTRETTRLKEAMDALEVCM